jgi:membrane protein implicated in regulation of membrane protease activity
MKGLSSCPFALMMTLTMIAIGWFAYRPLVGIPLVVVAAVCFGILTVRAIRRGRESILTGTRRSNNKATTQFISLPAKRPSHCI